MAQNNVVMFVEFKRKIAKGQEVLDSYQDDIPPLDVFNNDIVENESYQLIFKKNRDGMMKLIVFPEGEEDKYDAIVLYENMMSSGSISQYIWDGERFGFFYEGKDEGMLKEFENAMKVFAEYEMFNEAKFIKESLEEYKKLNEQ